MFKRYATPEKAIQGYGFVKKIHDADPVATRMLDSNTKAFLYDTGTKPGELFTSVVVSWGYESLWDDASGWAVQDEGPDFTSIDEFLEQQVVKTFW